jgi:hypothetical protein
MIFQPTQLLFINAALSSSPSTSAAESTMPRPGPLPGAMPCRSCRQLTGCRIQPWPAIRYASIHPILKTSDTITATAGSVSAQPPLPSPWLVTANQGLLWVMHAHFGPTPQGTHTTTRRTSCSNRICTVNTANRLGRCVGRIQTRHSQAPRRYPQCNTRANDLASRLETRYTHRSQCPHTQDSIFRLCSLQRWSSPGYIRCRMLPPPVLWTAKITHGLPPKQGLTTITKNLAGANRHVLVE